MNQTNNTVDFEEMNRLLSIKGYALNHVEGITRKMVHSWTKNDLIVENRKQSTKGAVYYFDAIELLWLSVINEMRQYGIPIKKIKICREGVFGTLVKDQQQNSYPAFNFYIIHALIYKVPVYLVFADHEGFYIVDDQQLFSKIREGAIHSGAFFLLNKHIENVFPMLAEEMDFNELSGLTEKEIIALQIIRKQTYTYIKITKKDNEIEMIEGVERVGKLERSKQITELLKLGEYQKIEIKQSNGKIASAYRTTRYRTPRK